MFCPRPRRHPGQDGCRHLWEAGAPDRIGEAGDLVVEKVRGDLGVTSVGEIPSPRGDEDVDAIA